jgi:uncharacterized Rmd1/YagE family protein
MRCIALCTAESYKMSAVASYYKGQGYGVRSYRKVLHLTHSASMRDIFIFSHGCIVLWGFRCGEERQILKQIEPFSVGILSQIEIDRFVFRRGNKTEIYTHPRFNADVITLESDNSQIKLAISYGLAQSIQLESYESLVQKLIDVHTPFFTNFAKTGKINLPRQELSKRIGEIFMARSLVNLNSEYLEAPEYFWEHSNVENYYGLTEKFLDITRRVNTLNQKLNVLHELFEMLTSQLQHSHSNFLEIIIIALIVIEIIISLVILH